MEKRFRRLDVSLLEDLSKVLDVSILGIAICIVLYIGYLNIIHYINLNKTYTYETQEQERNK